MPPNECIEEKTNRVVITQLEILKAPSTKDFHEGFKLAIYNFLIPSHVDQNFKEKLLRYIQNFKRLALK
jgi:hypothetical protein